MQIVEGNDFGWDNTDVEAHVLGFWEFCVEVHVFYVDAHVTSMWGRDG